jgi:hypothetical protein
MPEGKGAVMSIEVTYEDGSTTHVHGQGGSSHSGEVSVNRVRLICAKQALEVYIKSDGRFQVTANGAQLAIKNVITPITGKSYKRSMNGKAEALADCMEIIADIEGNATVREVEE